MTGKAKADTAITVRLDANRIMRVMELAAKEDRSVSGMIRRLIDMGLERMTVDQRVHDYFKLITPERSEPRRLGGCGLSDGESGENQSDRN